MEIGFFTKLIYHTFGFISYVPSLAILVTHRTQTSCYAVLEIVPVHVWQNADSLTAGSVSINIFLFAPMFFLLLLCPGHWLLP